MDLIECQSVGIIREVNAYQLDPALLAEAMESVAEARPDELRDFDGWVAAVSRAVVAAGLRPEEATLASMAIQFRYSALSRILRAGGAQGFTASVEPGRRSLQEVLVRCAAEEPLLDQEGLVSFDPVSFHQRLLRLASPAGKA